MAPALQGAVLSDFHAVALTASLLLWAFYFFDTNRWVGYFACIIAAMLTKEDIPVVIALMGLGILIARKQRVVGTGDPGAGRGLVRDREPRHPAHLQRARSLALLRAAGALGANAGGVAARAAMQDPMLVVRWVFKPEILIYLGGLLSSTGFMSIFALPFLLPMRAGAGNQRVQRVELDLFRGRTLLGFGDPLHHPLRYLRHGVADGSGHAR